MRQASRGLQLTTLSSSQRETHIFSSVTTQFRKNQILFLVEQIVVKSEPHKLGSWEQKATSDWVWRTRGVWLAHTL